MYPNVEMIYLYKDQMYKIANMPKTANDLGWHSNDLGWHPKFDLIKYDLDSIVYFFKF